MMISGIMISTLGERTMFSVSLIEIAFPEKSRQMALSHGMVAMTCAVVLQRMTLFLCFIVVFLFRLVFAVFDYARVCVVLQVAC